MRLTDIQLSGGQLAKFMNQSFRIGAGFSLDRGRHHRSRCFADGAGFALKCDVVDLVVVQLQCNIQTVAAQRIVPDGMVIGMIQFAVVARLAVMVKDDFLIQ